MTPYHIKAIVPVAGGPGVLVREFTFAPGEATPWHRHTEMSDRAYGLAGLVSLEIQGAGGAHLRPGDVAEVPVGETHRLVNHGAEEGRVLLVQSGGRYDFNEVADPA